MKKIGIVGMLFLLFIAGFWLSRHLLIARWGQDAPIPTGDLSSEALDLLEILPKNPIQISDRDTSKLLKLDKTSQDKILKIYQDNPGETVVLLKERMQKGEMDPKIKELSMSILQILETIPQRRLDTAKRIEQAKQDRRDWEKERADIRAEIKAHREGHPLQ